MVWSSDSDEEDKGWTLEANRHRLAPEAHHFVDDNEDELWNLYQCILDKCRVEGYPFFINNKLPFQDFVDFVLRHS